MFFYHLLNRMAPGQFWGTKLRFYRKMSYPLSLHNPKTFNEKINWRKAYDRNPLFPICADKLRVRDYVKDKIGEEHLIPLLYSGEQIDVDTLKGLEGEFVVKANHNSGRVHMVLADKPADLEAIAANINKQLQRPYSTKTGEWWYAQIPPRALIEKMLRSESGEWAEDYKFFVFNRNGEKEVILQMTYGKEKDMNVVFYDEALEPLPFKIHFNCDYRPFNKPKNYEKMVELAKTLAGDLDFCRVDLYNVDGAIYFGEMTFAPTNGLAPFDPLKYDRWMGDKWQLPNR
ncbi:ATP-grasp fold amidoligase family protein [Ferrimonas balearica]|uniref:ATP-grasp fold amidoligase family protein n=1 Tax=Ferrimonas balearica TaxID=44012 RepID=UPI002D7FD109|nr:ATP-grasp fold amidoligase family protein [Ferrimonas balearica]MBY6096266.1 glycosyl transferase [Ferrimonas balearica]